MQTDSELQSKASALALETDRQVKALPKAKTLEMRSVSRALALQLRDDPPQLVVALSLQLLRTGYRLIAHELIAWHKGALQSLDIESVEMLAGDLDSWHSVDVFCICVAGPCWREGQISDQDIARWASDASPWWRRSALVATTSLTVRARGGYGDSDRTLAVARMLIEDRYDTVVKALSWALRELVPWEPDRVEAFLEEHWDSLAARVRREVRNKLDTGLKNPKAPVTG